MKYINATLLSARPSSDKSRHPFGKHGVSVASEAVTPVVAPTTEEKLKDLLKTLEPEPSQKLSGRLLKMSSISSPDNIKREVSDILAILNGLNKK